MKLLVITTVLLIANATASAETIEGIVTTEKTKIPKSQANVVVWLDGKSNAKPNKKVPVMSQTGLQFKPRVLTVIAGQTVSFPNEDDVAHNVFSLSRSKRFKLGIYPKGHTREVKFEKPGAIDLFCSIHRHMHAVIIVTPNEHVVQSVFGKQFTIKDVPAGTYTLHTWNAAHKQISQKVVVPENGKVTLSVRFKKK